MSDLKWYSRYVEGTVIGLIAAGVWAGGAVLAHEQSSWFIPISKGFAGAIGVVIVSIGIIALRRLPKGPIKPHSRNIESCVRMWLDNYKVRVKNDPNSSNHFRLRLTLDSSIELTVLRNKEDYPEYVQIIGDLGIRGEDTKLLDFFSLKEKTQIIIELKMELARAKVGYSGLIDPPENFHVLRRVPIHHNLTEFGFMGMIGEIEDAMNLVRIVFLKAKIQADERHILESAMQQPASGIPAPELPPVSS